MTRNMFIAKLKLLGFIRQNSGIPFVPQLQKDLMAIYIFKSRNIRILDKAANKPLKTIRSYKKALEFITNE